MTSDASGRVPRTVYRIVMDGSAVSIASQTLVGTNGSWGLYRDRDAKPIREPKTRWFDTPMEAAVEAIRWSSSEYGIRTNGADYARFIEAVINIVLAMAWAERGPESTELDPTPVDEAWAKSVAVMEIECLPAVYVLSKERYIELWDRGKGVWWFHHAGHNITVTSRGQVRTLYRGLTGIELKEPS